MTEDEQRTAIAEYCGWTDIKRINRGEFGGLRGTCPYEGIAKIIPSYCRDLNYITKAEQHLSDELRMEFMLHLADMVMEYHVERISWTITDRMLSATAAQRAKALLKALQLWNDD